MFKVFTIFKYAVAYDSNAIWDCYACKLFAPFKGIPFNAVYGLRYFYAFKAGTFLERIAMYSCHAIGYDHAFEALTAMKYKGVYFRYGIRERNVFKAFTAVECVCANDEH